MSKEHVFVFHSVFCSLRSDNLPSCLSVNPKPFLSSVHYRLKCFLVNLAHKIPRQKFYLLLAKQPSY